MSFTLCQAIKGYVMSARKLSIILTVIAIMLFGSVSMASACAGGCGYLSLSCDGGSVVATWAAGVSTDLSLVKVSGPSGPSSISISGNSGTVTTPWANGTYTIEFRYLIYLIRASTITCLGAPAETTFSDGRLNNRHGDQIAIFPADDANGRGVQVWLAGGVDMPTFSVEISADELAALPDADTLTEPYLIAESDDGLVQVWLLPTGEVQFNYGPDSEGKIFVYRFTDLTIGSYEFETIEL